jgi:integrase
VVAELGAHLDRYVAPGPHALVFASPQGGLLSRPRFRTRVWLPALHAAGLEPPPRIHDLRHTAVSLWIAAGASPKEVAARAGHTSVRVVLDVYDHLWPEQDQALAARLDEMIGDAGPAKWGSEHR